MKEQIFVIVNGEKMQLDLNQPSGITLNFASNLFKDLSKISSSYSYTFKLPKTQNNRFVLDLADDIRHSSSMVRKKLKAEYLQNGINILGSANLYVDSVETGYSCVLTWGVLDGLIKMGEEDVSIQKLGSALYYLPAITPSYAKPSDYGLTYDNTSMAFSPTYSAGVPYVNNWARTYHESSAVSQQNVARGYGEEFTAEYLEGDYKSYSYYPPLPVVNLRYLLGLINTRYSLGLDFYSDRPAWSYNNLLAGYTSKDDEYDPTNNCTVPIYTHDLINAGVVPCVTSERASIADATTLILSASSVKLMNGSNNKKAVMTIEETDYSYKNNSATMAEYRDVLMQRVSSLGNRYASITLYRDTKINIGGYLKVNSTVSYFTITRIDGTHYDTMKTIKREDTQFEFRGEYGGSEESLFLPEGEYVIRFPELESQVSSSGYTIAMDMHLTFATNSEDGMYDTYIELFKSLPDIKCMDLLKSVFYAIGAYPLISADGRVSLGYYDTLGTNKANGNAVDWSDKLLVGQEPTVKYSAGDFKYRNYYLMKNEQLEAKDRDEKDDVFASPMFNVECPNELLGAKQAVYTFPYTGAYLVNGDWQTLPTGNTMKYWDKTKTAPASAKASEPVLGITYLHPVKTRLSGGGEEYRGERVLSVEMWDTSLLTECNSYKYLTKILENMVSVKVKLRLTEMDLLGLDYTKPVYLDKFNAYFALVSITASAGVSTVELIKLP